MLLSSSTYTQLEGHATPVKRRDEFHWQPILLFLRYFPVTSYIYQSIVIAPLSPETRHIELSNYPKDSFIRYLFEKTLNDPSIFLIYCGLVV